MDREIKAILFSGIRGTGKTTLARVYAKALNCENFKSLGEVCNQCSSCLEADNGTHPDILEMDAASNNGVDFVRELDAVFRQIETFKKRVIIFDEVHMFTAQAQAALLKTLEEPPSNLVFILSTTDPDRLTATVRSRCLSMPLKPLTSFDVANNLRKIIKSEGREASEDFVQTLALQGGGSLRDVQQLLDQAMLASGEESLDISYLEEAIGIISISQYKELAPVLCSMNLRTALDHLEDWYRSGVDLELLYKEGVPNLLRDFSIVSADLSISLLSGIPAEVMKKRLTLSPEYIRIISEKWEKHLEMLKGVNVKLVWTMFFISIFSKEEPVVQKFPEY
jgi:DNA polymerase-3 subunit gamma/tau